MPPYHQWHIQPHLLLHFFRIMEHSTPSQRHTDAITRTHILRILTDYAPTLLKLNDATITFNKVQLKLAPSHMGPHILVSYTKTTSYY